MARTNNMRVFYPVSGDLFAAIMERRMAEHKHWQDHVANVMAEEIIDEVQSLPPRAPRNSGRLFELLPEGSIVVDLEERQ